LWYYFRTVLTMWYYFRTVLTMWYYFVGNCSYNVVLFSCLLYYLPFLSDIFSNQNPTKTHHEIICFWRIKSPYFTSCNRCINKIRAKALKIIGGQNHWFLVVKSLLQKFDIRRAVTWFTFAKYLCDIWRRLYFMCRTHTLPSYYL
jgi:hypothetical protein